MNSSQLVIRLHDFIPPCVSSADLVDILSDYGYSQSDQLLLVGVYNQLLEAYQKPSTMLRSDASVQIPWVGNKANQLPYEDAIALLKGVFAEFSILPEMPGMTLSFVPKSSCVRVFKVRLNVFRVTEFRRVDDFRPHPNMLVTL